MPQAALFGDAIAPVQSPHQLVIDTWSRLWQETRGVKWSWTAKDASFVKRTLAQHAHGDAGLVLARLKRLLLDPPRPWYATEASPAILFSHWNALAVRLTGAGTVEKAKPKPKGCAACGAHLERSSYPSARGDICALCHYRS